VHRRDTQFNEQVIKHSIAQKEDEVLQDPYQNYDPSIKYLDFSPPSLWQVPYSILRVKFLPTKRHDFMSHLGEEILVPINSTTGGAVQYYFLVQDINGAFTRPRFQQPLKYGELVRINCMVPHHTWAEGVEADAWMIFEDASETTPAIRTDVTKNSGLRARKFSSDFFEKYPEYYPMVALGISETIRLYRNRAGFHISDLARLCGIDRAHLSKAEEGKANLSIEAVMRIAVILGFDAPSLFSAKSWEYKTSSLDDISEKAPKHLLCGDNPHNLHPRTWRIPKGKKQEIRTMHPLSFGSFSSWLVLKGEVIFEIDSLDEQIHRKELLQEGAVLHLRGLTKICIEGRVKSQLLEIIRSPLCPTSYIS
jgi:transcriptional regulator with XRE-family HTH domain